MKELAGINVGKKSSINLKMVALKVKVKPKSLSPLPIGLWFETDVLNVCCLQIWNNQENFVSKVPS